MIERRKNFQINSFEKPDQKFLKFFLFRFKLNALILKC